MASDLLSIDCSFHYNYNESFNGKRDELFNGEIFYTLKEAEVLIERCRREYCQDLQLNPMLT